MVDPDTCVAVHPDTVQFAPVHFVPSLKLGSSTRSLPSIQKKALDES